MRINWTVRLRNKTFWLTMIPTLLLLVEQVLNIFGVSMNFMGLEEQLMAVISTVFMVLGTLGVVVDPTTKGMSDSARAMRYKVPNDDPAERL